MRIRSYFAMLFNRFKRKGLATEDPVSTQRESAKCHQCGNDVELLLPCIAYDDPVVYKCVHCQCTITEPGTSAVSESGKLIPSWSENEKIINLKSGKIKFVGEAHGSVGLTYEVIYPKDAFSARREYVYCHPEKMKIGMCGGDRATVEYTLTPLKAGLFCITEETHFRGELEECRIHYYLVE